MDNHPEGHPDNQIPGDNWIRVLEGFLEPARLNHMLNTHAAIAKQYTDKGAYAAQMGQPVLGALNDIIASIHSAAYNDIIMQIGVIRRLERMEDAMEALVSIHAGEEDDDDPQTDVGNGDPNNN